MKTNPLRAFGESLSRMIMPNIGAFIAWGFMTAIFMERGWFPNESIATLIQPTLRYLLPLLIAYQGGKMTGGDRGAIVGAVACIGVIMGSDIPMFIGAMCIGPFSGWVLRLFDRYVGSHSPESLKVLVDNFSAGLLGIACAILGFFAIGPLVGVLTSALAAAVQFLIDHSLIPLLSLVIEPAKVFFLNNAINHGIFTPVGIEQIAEGAQSSIVFLIEPNPGPGLGILLAYSFFGNGDAKASALGAAIVHFFGGIHEISFPYVLMNPALLLATIGGSVTALLYYSVRGAGLVSMASPGSIVALLAMAPKGGTWVILGGVVMATLVSFIIASIILKSSKKNRLPRP